MTNDFHVVVEDLLAHMLEDENRDIRAHIKDPHLLDPVFGQVQLVLSDTNHYLGPHILLDQEFALVVWWEVDEIAGKILAVVKLGQLVTQLVVLQRRIQYQRGKLSYHELLILFDEANLWVSHYRITFINLSRIFITRLLNFYYFCYLGY